MQQFQLKFIFIVLNFILVFKKKRFMELYRVSHIEMVFLDILTCKNFVCLHRLPDLLLNVFCLIW